MVNNMTKEIQKIGNQLSVVVNDVRWIRKEIEGNGKEGLIKETKRNTDFRIESQTKTKMWMYAIGSGWLVTIMIIILQIIGVI